MIILTKSSEIFKIHSIIIGFVQPAIFRGTGVASRAVAELSDKGEAPTALVLEAPFNNLHDVISNHPFSVPFRFLPYVFLLKVFKKWTFLAGLKLQLLIR